MSRNSGGMLFLVLIIVSYGFMVIAQYYGAEVIEVLHGEEARDKATSPQYEDVKSDTPLHQLCKGYDAHHYDPVSNCLHAAGMILTFISICSFCLTMQARILLTRPPIWYLYAWVGHFFLQKDIPAVFVYGMTLRGWLSGEYCSICSLVSGRTISLPWELVLTSILVMIHLLLVSPIAGWNPIRTKSKDS